MTTFREILAALPMLQPGERATIKKAIDALQGHAPIEPLKRSDKTPRPEWTEYEHEVINALHRFMRRKGAEVIIVSHLNTDDKFRDKVVSLYQFIKTFAHTRTEERVVLDMGYDLIYNQMIANGAKFDNVTKRTTAEALLSRIHRMPTLINRQFPGYAASGLLHWIFKRDADVREKQNHPPEHSRRRTPGGS